MSQTTKGGSLPGEIAMQELILERGRTEKNYWRDLWRYRELLAFLAWRDILVRYKQTAIGVLWAVLRPFITMVIFTIVFGKLGKFPSPEGVPYGLLVLAAMLPWQFFATGMVECSGSLVNSANLISKVYFPRLIVPCGTVITSCVDFVIMLGLMAGVMGWYGFLPDWRLIMLPVFAGLTFALALGAGLWFSALTVKYRDFRYVVPFVAQFGLFISPVGFSSAVVPERWQWLYSLNPMVGIIDGFRWSLLRGEVALWWPGLGLAILMVGLLCASGIWYFRHTERSFADVI